MEKKMTYVKALEVVVNGETITDEVMAKLVALKASLEKKNGGEKKPTATQQANVGLKSAILSAMMPNVKYTIAELVALVPELSSCQKATALLQQMLKDGTVDHTTEKRKSLYFVIAE